MFQGSTLFLGDSMTVGTSALVSVDGPRSEVAKVGAPSTWALAQVETLPTLSSFRNMVVLTGVNDIGGRSASAIAATIEAIWRRGQGQGVKVYGCTLPPFAGWAAFNPIGPFEDKRIVLNRLLRERARATGVTIIPLDELLADPSDHSRLDPRADSGDHLHPKKDVLAKALSLGALALPYVPPANPGSSAVPLIAGLALAGFCIWKLHR